VGLRVPGLGRSDSPGAIAHPGPAAEPKGGAPGGRYLQQAEDTRRCRHAVLRRGRRRLVPRDHRGDLRFLRPRDRRPARARELQSRPEEEQQDHQRRRPDDDGVVDEPAPARGIPADRPDPRRVGTRVQPGRGDDRVRSGRLPAEADACPAAPQGHHRPAHQGASQGQDLRRERRHRPEAGRRPGRRVAPDRQDRERRQDHRAAARRPCLAA
jgi:hypothetical protein